MSDKAITIKEYLSMTGQSVNDFAKQLECAPQTLSYVANGRRAPSFTFAKKLRQASGGKITLEGIWAPFEDASLQ